MTLRMLSTSQRVSQRRPNLPSLRHQDQTLNLRALTVRAVMMNPLKRNQQLILKSRNLPQQSQLLKNLLQKNQLPKKLLQNQLSYPQPRKRLLLKRQLLQPKSQSKRDPLVKPHHLSPKVQKTRKKLRPQLQREKEIDITKVSLRKNLQRNLCRSKKRRKRSPKR